MTFRLAVFDCDGTLVDSQYAIVAAMHMTCQALDLGLVDSAVLRKGIGLPLAQAIGRALPGADDATVARAVEVYKQICALQREARDHEEPLFPGIREALVALEETGALFAIATGKGRRGLINVLERHGLREKFPVLMTADDGPGKPHPFMLLEAMAQLGVSPEDTVMIGDTTYDIEMARNAGTAAIGVAWGYHPVEELEAAGAHGIAHRPEELLNEVLNVCKAGSSRPVAALG